MPGPIHTGAISATSGEVDELRRQVAELGTQLHAVLASLERRQNPAPQDSGGFMMQLLLAEKDRSERLAQQLGDLQNPLNQLDQLQALSALMPQAPAEDNSTQEMLQEVIGTVGAIVAAKMGQKEASKGSGGATGSDEEDDQGIY